jgi:hypothetical protein
MPFEHWLLLNSLCIRQASCWWVLVALAIVERARKAFFYAIATPRIGPAEAAPLAQRARKLSSRSFWGDVDRAALPITA